MKTIQHTTTLFYYDGPQDFEARDMIGGHYVAVMVEPKNGHDRYLVAGVAPERLRQFRAGTLNLRSLLAEAGAEEWYLTTATTGLDQPLVLELQAAPLTASGLLPDEGFLLHDRPAEGIALREAREPNNLGGESLTLVGALEKVNRGGGTWGLLTEEGVCSGKVREGGPSLDGLKVGGRYRFSCVEEIEEVEGTGREQRTLYLIEHEPA
jgi:hypothetical protein